MPQVDLNFFGGKKPVQIGLVVDNIEQSARAYSAYFGLEQPVIHMTETMEQAKTLYRGKPTPARAKLAFIPFGDITMELIEPVDGPSTWRDFLEAHGPGVHHIAFEVKDIDRQVELMEQKGAKLVQCGQWTTGRGGRYAYLDSMSQLSVTIELLECF